MKKKKLHIIIILLVIILLFLFFPRSTNKMEKIACTEFKRFLFSSNLNLEINDFKGPVVTKSNILNGAKFTWYKILPFNDTAMISINVNKRISLGTTNTANYSFNYLSEPNKKITSIFNSKKKYSEKTIFSLHEKQEFLYHKDSLPYLTISPEKLIYLINNGYFDKIHQVKNVYMVLFEEPIGYVEVQKNKEYTIGARITEYDSLKLFIEPVHISDTIYNNLVYKKNGIEYIK